MDKFLKKRKANEDSPKESETPKVSQKKAKKVGSETHLVCLPGASVNLSAGILACLEKLRVQHGFTLHKTDKIKWNTFAAKSPDNQNAVLALCPKDQDFYVLGNSFGNRVICEMLKEGKFPSTCKGFILCGFPLYGNKNAPDRVSQLKSIPRDSNVMVVSGTLDEFLHREFCSKKGKDLLSQVFNEMKLTKGQLHFIENGVHDLPKCKGGKQCNVAGEARLLELVTAFCV